MNINEAKVAILNAFNAAWADRQPVDTDNDDFNEPQGEPWARIVIRTQPTSQDTLGRIGNRKFLRVGIVFLQLFAPVKTGTYDLDILAEEMRELFEGTRLGGIWFYETQLTENGEDGKYYSYTLQSLFNYEQVK